MKKLTAFLGAIIASILFVFTGCSNDNFTKKVYNSGDISIDRIIIDVIDRDLEILASEDDEIYIDYFDSDKEYLDIAFSNNQLTIKLLFNKNWTDFIGFKPSAEYRKIQVKIPTNTIIDFSASTTNEDIKITSLSFVENVTLNSNGGNIICDHINVGKSINLTAKNGDITGTILGTLDDFSTKCTIKKGKCNLPLNKKDGAKTFIANCNNGNIDIDFVKN